MPNEITKKEDTTAEMREKFSEILSEIQKWGPQNLNQKEIYAVSKMAVSCGLDPFLRHIELGSNTYITLAGLRAYAENKKGGIVAEPKICEVKNCESIFFTNKK